MNLFAETPFQNQNLHRSAGEFCKSSISIGKTTFDSKTWFRNKSAAKQYCAL